MRIVQLPTLVFLFGLGGLGGFGCKPSAKNHLDNGRARYDQADYVGAIADYSSAIRQNPNLSRAFAERGIVRQKMGDPDGAITDLTEAIRLDPKAAEAYCNRSVACQSKGDFDDQSLMRQKPSAKIQMMQRLITTEGHHEE